MGDLINRQDAIDATWFEPSYTDPLNVLTEVRDRLKALPPAQSKTAERTAETHACDLISRQALCEYALNQKDKSVTPNDIMRFPSVQQEQKKGKWERIYLDHVASGERPSIFYCSSCNQCVPFPTNFCPACGSDNRQR